MAKKNTGMFILNIIMIAALAAALILTVVSSGKAYALTHLPQILAAGIVGIVICILMLAVGGKLGSVVKDAAYLGVVAATAYALTTMIAGRVLLMGYVYFSDLESNNPVAVSAMNIAIAAWVCFAVALIAGIIVGFSRKD